MMRYIAILILAMLIPISCFAEDQEPTVLVSTIPVQQGTLPQIVTGYGTVEPLPGGSTNISLLRAGQVDTVSVSAGQKVKQGDSLLSFTSDPSALLTYDQAVTTLNAAKKEQTRIQQLLTQHLATQSQLTAANKVVTDAESALKVQKEQGSDLKSQTLNAPFDGTVTNISVNSGDRVVANATLLQVAHGSGLAVGFGLPLDDLLHIQIGQPVHMEALDANRPAIDGNVAFVSNMLDPKTRVAKILVTVPAETTISLIQGEQFKADVEIAKLSGVIVPRLAVLKDEKGAFIYQVKDGKAQRIEIKIVGESGDNYVINGQLDSKSQIVTVGNYELKDGAAVRQSDNKETSGN